MAEIQQYRLYGGLLLRYGSPPMIRKASKATKTKPTGALGSRAY
jgi:hypothetical protein